MTATPDSPTPATRSWTIPPVPQPDTPEGRVLAYALIAATVYALLVVADNVSLANLSASFIQLPLILATIATFAIAGMLASDYARIRQFELELARTVSVHSGADQLPEPDSPLGNVLKEYARTSADLRQHARAHAYAAGPAVWGTLLTLAATVCWGLSIGSGAIWMTYLALVIELPALTLLVFSMSVLGTAIGVRRAVAGFDALTPRRWRRYSQRSSAVDDALKTCPWLDQFVRDLRESEPTTPAARPTGAWVEA